jgi:hypothetical protein
MRTGAHPRRPLVSAFMVRRTWGRPHQVSEKPATIMARLK